MDSQPAFLYVEDNPAGHMVMRIMLQKLLGYARLVILEDTANLVPRIKAFKLDFDVIFLDLNIKPLDGYQACAALRRDDQLRQAKIVALTASVKPDDVENLKMSGFDGVIYKPLYPDQFSLSIQQLLNGQTLW